MLFIFLNSMLITYILITIILFCFELVYFKIAGYYNIIDKPNNRSSHKSIVLRGGGIVFWFGSLVFFIISGALYPLFFIGLTVIVLVSFWDDVKSLPDNVRLVAQTLSIGLMFFQWGIVRTEMWWIVILALILCVGIINAYNFMDGINGMTGGYSISVLLPLLFMNRRVSLSPSGVVGYFIEPSFLIIAILSVLVFCFFNFRKQAKCFAGDVGSIGICFIILFALGKLVLWTRDLTYLIFLAVYGVDTVLTICHRIILHENLGVAHRKHAYQLMANELELPHVLVSLIYTLIQAVISVGFYMIPSTTVWHWGFFVGVLLLLCLMYFLFIKKYYYLHDSYLKSLSK